MSERRFEILDDVAAAELHRAAWQACNRKAWYFGNASNDEHATPFWKMDLDGVAAFDALWEAARSRCEALAGGPLRVIRQYANGHTYGLGGSAHHDDTRPGTFTLLYYPMPAWEHDWDGETVFFDAAGEVTQAVRPRPNRAVFFDSRIPHAGRAPSRSCMALRVTVAFKLERFDESGPAGPVEFQEMRREGPLREYTMRVGEELVERAAAEQLAALGRSVRLPGFRPGRIPQAVLRQRYGARARSDAIRKLVLEYAGQAGPEGSMVSAAEVVSASERGGVEVKVTTTSLRDLPEVAFSAFELERLVPDPPEPDAEAIAELHLREQVMDRLSEAYAFPIASILIEREFEALWKAAQEQVAAGEVDRGELRLAAERRVRLGVVVAEIARRHGISERTGSELEDRVIAWITAQARVTERLVPAAELREMD
jgi:hypothetical protein